ncbi:MAG: anti-sigma factor [Bacteroidetes bacterium]|nr:anti-sigma factor [Bacteroidota bacterium]
MNLQEYIASGILEAYALGELTEAERKAVELNTKQYPELFEELKRIEETNETILLNLAVQPNALLKTKLTTAISPDGKTILLNSSSSIWKYAVAASVAVTLGMGYLAYDYRAKWKNSEVTLNNLIAQNRLVAQDYNRVHLKLDRIENDLKIIDNPDFKKIVMTGTSNAPQALASVYWNNQTKEVFLSVQNLRALSNENQYQLWAIVNGKPVDAGVFDGTTAGLIKMKTADKEATTFAVTIEPKGGSTSPTLQTMQVAGNVGKG